ncbi:MAG TPA: lipid IV(A) palmitoyltransferase PagP [Burkholderiaceae bacterium]|nr:lipid IV(A) palmitoyltransferase PagP [Burkholderiaceae bacterium]
MSPLSRCALGVVLAVSLASSCHADDAASTVAPSAPMSRWDRASQAVSQTLEQVWHSDQYELYVPLHIWHNRAYYSAQKIAMYNENPWGVGIGKYRYDTDGDWHALYAMAFLESHNKVEPIVGYGFQKIWRPGGSWRLGAGFTAGVTTREDYHYVPIPVLLPLASIEYGRLSLQTTYIPGGNGNGNVLFTWLRWRM